MSQGEKRMMTRLNIIITNEHVQSMYVYKIHQFFVMESHFLIYWYIQKKRI